MSIVTTIKDKCQACYSCIRNCPVKAIKVEDGQAKVVDKRCISCGNCVKVCAQKAKQIIWDREGIIELLKEEKVAAIVAPSFAASFPRIPIEQLGAALKKLGFSAVEEVIIGVELTVKEYKNLLNSTDKPIISSFCPAIVGYIEKHSPDLIKYLAPIDSAMIATAKYVKNKYPDYKVVFIGPCAAKKEEAINESNHTVDVVLTFKEIKTLFKDSNIEINDLIYDEDKNIPGDSKEFPLTGGLVKNLKLESKIIDNQVAIFEGFENCSEILKDLEKEKINPKFLDLLFCRGCIDGPEIDSPEGIFNRKNLIINRQVGRSSRVEGKYLPLNLERKFNNKYEEMLQPSEDEINEILNHTFKSKAEDELNCGACGYQTCRDKAIAVYQGLAEIDMCFPYLLHKSRGEIEYYRDRLQGNKQKNNYLELIIGESEQIRQIKKIIKKAAPSDAPILIHGERGTGKEIIAKGVHYLSKRKDKPFIGINCGSLPEILLEYELFGYEEGAFTGARKGGKEGKFELANGGTLLLDEIGDMPLPLQGKLLKVLQDKEVERVGGSKNIKLDIRIIATTNQDIKKLVQEGKFRVDLYYRLNVIDILVPALKERKIDIPILAGHFIQKTSREKSIQPRIISEDAMKTLVEYSWPGNVRELENAIERAMYVAEGAVVLLEHLLPSIQIKEEDKPILQVRPFREAIRELEAKLIQDALKATNNNRVNAALLLDMPRATLYQKLREYDIK